MSRAAEDIKVGNAMKSQLNKLAQLEPENAKLKEEVQYLRYIDFLPSFFLT